MEAYRLLWNCSLTDSTNIKNTLSKFIESYKIACKIRKNHSDISDVLCGRLSYIIAYLYTKLAESSERLLRGIFMLLLQVPTIIIVKLQVRN